MLLWNLGLSTKKNDVYLFLTVIPLKNMLTMNILEPFVMRIELKVLYYGSFFGKVRFI